MRAPLMFGDAEAAGRRLSRNLWNAGNAGQVGMIRIIKACVAIVVFGI